VIYSIFHQYHLRRRTDSESGGESDDDIEEGSDGQETGENGEEFDSDDDLGIGSNLI